MVRSAFSKIGTLAVVTVVIPTLLGILYFGFVASDIYISESRFVVRSPDKPAPSGIGVILKTAGFTTSGDEVYAAKSFVQSRDALRELDRNGAFRKAYGSDNVSIFNRFGPMGYFDSFESLYKYFQGKVTVETDAATSISTLTVRAYNPEDARRINEQLLTMAETTVNKLNERGRKDLVRYAEAEVDTARSQATAAAVALAAYRNQAGVVDPEKQAAVQLQMVSKLQDELIATKTQLIQLRTYTPQNPQIEVLQTKIGSLNREIADQMGQVAGSSKSLAGTAVRYQRLLVESTVAEKQLASALGSLEQARNEALRKQAYVERIVSPNLPDSPLEPKRWRGMIATFVASLFAYAIFRMLLAALLEHRD